MRSDIVIVGGGIIGSSIAYFLSRTGRVGSVSVIEPDSTYAVAATPVGFGGVRRQFGLPENIEMSKYSHAFYLDFAETMAVDGEEVPIDFRRQGYLLLADAAGAHQLEENHRLQRALGVPVDLLDRALVRDLFPSLASDRLTLAAHTPDDGWLDPHAALRGFRRKAQSLGAVYVEDRVGGFEVAGGVARAVNLASGRRLGADVFVNAAGAWAGGVARLIGMPLPVEPMARLTHFFRTRAKLAPLPLIKDQPGLALRPEGTGFIGGLVDWDTPAGFRSKIDHDYFEQAVWPALAAWIPAFEAVREERVWLGHYARNALDGNLILGSWLGGVENFYVACGFTGHGIMHAPAVGLALAELVLDGRFSTLDLSRLSYRRIRDEAPYPEKGIR